VSSDADVLAAWALCQQEGRPPDPALAAAIDGLFRREQGRVYALCRRMMKSEEAALDLTQEALMTAYRKLPDFRGESAFGTWVYGIAKMLCLNAIRRRREVLSEDGVLDPGDPGISALGRLRMEEREELLRRATASLSPLEQEAVYLRYVEEMPQSAITEVLGITQSSGARGVLQKCRRVLTRELRAALEEMGHGTSFIRMSRS
jgi:RNA polymerase sigma-70 factor (ECF subfamily)